jgi:ankyrin repeat protein
MHDSDLVDLLAALESDESDPMLGFFTNPSMAIRYRFTERIPSTDPIIHSCPPLSSVAAYFGAINCLHVLSERGDKFGFLDKQDRSIADFAVMGGHLNVVEYIGSLSIPFQPSLPLIAQFGRTAILNFTIQNLAVDPSILFKSQRNILHIASIYDRLEIAKYIAAHLPQIDVNSADEEGNTALHLAVSNASISVTKHLLSLSNIDRNPVNSHSETLLHLAASQPNPDILTSILAIGGFGESNQTWTFMTMDYLAVAKDLDGGSEDPILPAIEVDLNARDENGFTPFLRAVKSGHHLSSFFLIEGVDRNARARVPFAFRTAKRHSTFRSKATKLICFSCSAATAST